MTKTTIFANSRWRTAAILKTALSPYLRRNLSNFYQIWYTGANFHCEHGNLTKKSILFQIQDGGRTPYWKSYVGYISAPYWPINANFGMEMKNHMQILVSWPRGVSRSFVLRPKRIRILRGGDKFLLQGDYYAILRIHYFASYIKCTWRHMFLN